MSVNPKFVAALHLALDQYEAFFSTTKSMPKGRSRDVLALREIINAPHPTNDDLRAAIEIKLRRTKNSGVFRKSRLHRSVERVLNHPDYSQVNLLREDMLATVSSYRATLSQGGEDELPEAMQDEFEQAELTIRQQHSDIERLTAHNTQLERQVASLRESEAALKDKNAELMENNFGLMEENRYLRSFTSEAMAQQSGTSKGRKKGKGKSGELRVTFQDMAVERQPLVAGRG